MSVIFIALPAAIVLVVGALIAFIWSVRVGQFDDLDTPALRVAHDEDDLPISPIRDVRGHAAFGQKRQPNRINAEMSDGKAAADSPRAGRHVKSHLPDQPQFRMTTVRSSTLTPPS